MAGIEELVAAADVGRHTPAAHQTGRGGRDHQVRSITGAARAVPHPTSVNSASALPGNVITARLDRRAKLYWAFMGHERAIC